MSETNSKPQNEIFIIVPAYNEEKTVVNVVTELCEMDYMVLVVDDGSQDNTYALIKDLQLKYPEKLLVLQHVINRGLGAALKTGMDAAHNHGAKYVVTFDADGQHDPHDIVNVCKPLQNGEADVVLGDRNFKEMPKSKMMANYIMNTITVLFYGIYAQDSQSGLRAFTDEAAQSIEIHARGYGVSSEIVREVKRNHLKLKEVPIKTIYTSYSIAKGTNASVGLEILVKMIIDILKRF